MSGQQHGDNRHRFDAIAARMAKEGEPDLAVETFRRYYNQLLEGEQGLIGTAGIEPMASAPDLEQLDDFRGGGREALARAAVIKLNGGLGTSMGLDRAKSLLVAKDGLTFLDIIVRHVLHTRRITGASVPLVFMNSFSTEADVLQALGRYPDLAKGQAGVRLSFIQHKVPKISQDTLAAVEWPADPAKEWCPPGHGDIYTAVMTSGLLDDLLDRGYRYAFIANADNLGAALDLNLLGYFAARKLPFMMEVADRTDADRKGGHVARTRNGRIILRESAQCPADEIEDFQDISRHRYFNTNNLWVNLEALRGALRQRNGILGLPLIRNCKTVDPRDKNSPKVFQLETAMGSAISVFTRAEVIRVPRDRFVPVKTTEDLLALRSDAYVLTDDMRVMPHPERKLGPVIVSLDPRFYGRLDQLDARFPHGAPSLRECEGLGIDGDFRFGRNVTLRGKVLLTNASGKQKAVPDDAVIGA